jgi:hypothetical protein
VLHRKSTSVLWFTGKVWNSSSACRFQGCMNDAKVNDEGNGSMHESLGESGKMVDLREWR